MAKIFLARCRIRLCGLVSRRRHDLCFRRVRDKRFLRGPKSRAHQHTVSTKHERRRKAAAIGNATCGKHENIGRPGGQRVHH